MLKHFQMLSFIVVNTLGYTELVHSHLALTERNKYISTKHNRLKNPIWQEADQKTSLTTTCTLSQCLY